MRNQIRIGVASLAVTAACALMATATAQSQQEAYVANASLKTAGGASVTAPVSITIAGWTSDTDRGQVGNVLKSGGGPALRKWLAGRKTLGTITVGRERFEAKYVYAQASSVGRIITLATAGPMFFVGAGKLDAKPTTDHDLGVVTIEVDGKGTGNGTLTPAAKVRMSPSGALIIEDYSAELVTLPDVKKK